MVFFDIIKCESRNQMKTLKTKRLILRDFKISDVNDFFAYASVPGVGEDAGWPHHQTISESETVLKNFIARGNEYAIVYKENKKVIGSMGIYDKLDLTIYENNNQKEIGYVLSKEHWGKGLMTEALKRVIAHLFDEIHVYALWCYHFDFNHRSQRVIEKCGFKFIRNEITEATHLNKKYNSCVYCLLNDDYQMQKREIHHE